MLIRRFKSLPVAIIKVLVHETQGRLVVCVSLYSIRFYYMYFIPPMTEEW